MVPAGAVLRPGYDNGGEEGEGRGEERAVLTRGGLNANRHSCVRNNACVAELRLCRWATASLGAWRVEPNMTCMGGVLCVVGQVKDWRQQRALCSFRAQAGGRLRLAGSWQA